MYQIELDMRTNSVPISLALHRPECILRRQLVQNGDCDRRFHDDAGSAAPSKVGGANSTNRVGIKEPNHDHCRSNYHPSFAESLMVICKTFALQLNGIVKCSK